MNTTEVPERRYRIAEVGRLTGFKPTTLRFYENSGVVAAPKRTPAGYRSYDDRDAERLRLIARAKELGCTLDEIAGLVEAWDADECGPVKHQLRSLVNAKIADFQHRIREQVAFAAELQATAVILASRPVDGPCDAACGCTTSGAPASASELTAGADCTSEPAGAEPVTLLTRRGGNPDPPIACSLSGGDMQARIGEWQSLLASVEDRNAITDGLRLFFSHPAPVTDIARLAAAEYDCCPFFTFTLGIDSRGVTLE